MINLISLQEGFDPVNDGNLEFDKSKVYQADRTAFAIPEVQIGEEAGRLGLKADCSEMIRYTTPKDHIFNTNFIRSLIGFLSSLFIGKGGKG